MAGGDGVALVCDVSDSAAVDAAFARVESELGPVDVLVNNAGAVGTEHLRRVTPLLERQRAEAADGARHDAPRRARAPHRRRVAPHARHPPGRTFYCTRAAVRAMAPRGRGIIVNMASICGLEGCTRHPHYSAAKAATSGSRRRAAKELIVQGIRVNAVAPGQSRPDAVRDQRRASRDRRVDAGGAAGRARRDRGHLRVPRFRDAGYFDGAVLGPNGGLVTA